MSEYRSAQDRQPEAPQMVEVFPGLSVGGTHASSIFAGLTEDEKVGAVVGVHRGGNFIVYLDLYKHGSREKRPLLKSSWRRWLIARGICLPAGVEWAYQGNYWGACTGSSSWSKSDAIACAKRAIDEMISRREERGHK